MCLYGAVHIRYDKYEMYYTIFDSLSEMMCIFSSSYFVHLLAVLRRHTVETSPVAFHFETNEEWMK